MHCGADVIVAAAGILFRTMQSKKSDGYTRKELVVVGGAGLIGSHTVDRLLQEDVKEVVIYETSSVARSENLAGALRDPRVKIFEAGGDIMQTDILEQALAGADGVFHLAALWLLQCHEFPRSAFDVNVRGTFNVSRLRRAGSSAWCIPLPPRSTATRWKSR